MTAPESPVAAPRDAARLGTAAIDPPGPVVAGSHGTWTVTFTCGPRGIDSGGGIRVHTDSDTDGGIPQVSDPAAHEFTTVSGPAASTVGLRIADEKSVEVLVLGAALAPGDAVSLTIGDRSGGGPGSRAQTFAEARRAFRVSVDPDGSGVWTPLPDPPCLAIVGGEAESLSVVAPSLARPGEPFRLLVRAVDRWGNPAQTWNWEVTLSGDGWELPETAHTFGPKDGGVWWLDGCVLRAPGLHRVWARATDAGGGEIVALSNPVRCVAQPGPHRLFWGDPHGGQIADASKIPAFFRYARDVAGIDFAGYQRNDHTHSNADYAAQQAAEREFDQPGRFVPMPGFEWTGEPSMGGHHNVYFRRHGQPMRRNSHQGVADKSDAHEDLPHVLDLHRAYRGTDTLITPHVGGGHADLTYHEPTLEPALEITSDHGTFEWFLRESLERGYRMGFVGGSDSHNGRPGADSPGHQERRYAKGGLTALLAGELTLAGVHEALRARRCYATTGARILLDVNVGGHLMGTEFQASAPPEITVSVTGTAPIESVTLYRGLEPVYEHDLQRKAEPRRLRVLWEGASRRTSYSGVIWDGELRAARHGSFGSVERLRFDSPRSQIHAHTDGALAWHSVACGYRSGFVVGLDGDEDTELECTLRTSVITRPRYGGHGDSGRARMSYSPAEAVAFRFSLGSVARRPLRVYVGPPDRWITISLGPAAGNADETQFAYVDQAPDPGLNPYWVRVVQEDQEMAWSSPIFVDFVA